MRLIALLILAGQQGLDAPIETRPTVGTEIRRGYSAGESCADVTVGADALRPCFERIRNRARENTTNSDAFELGLNLQKYRAAQSYLVVLKDSKRSMLVENWTQDAQLAELEASDDIRHALTRLNITMTQAATATGSLGILKQILPPTGDLSAGDQGVRAENGRPHPDGGAPAPKQ